MPYLSIMAAPVKTSDKDAYLEHARTTWPAFQRHGATAMSENWGVDIPDGKLTSFPMSVKLEADEAIVVSWIVWPDKATCDAAWQNLENEPEMAMMKMPFDGRRMIFGGFETILEG